MKGHWRNTMRITRFFAFDARAAAPFMVFMMHIRLWTFILFVASLVLFWGLEKRGLTFGSAMRAFRVWLLGKKRPALLWTKRRKMVDTGSK